MAMTHYIYKYLGTYSIPHNIANGPLAISTMSSSPQIDTIQSSNLKQILDAALSDYKKNTGNELLDQPLTIEVQCCDTADAALTILQDQVKNFQQFKDGDHRLMEQIGPLTQVLFAFSGTLGVGDVNLVLLSCGGLEVHSNVTAQAIPPAKGIIAGVAVLLSVCFLAFVQ
jgi:hypothetical protein